jgi:hypothetical protein
MHIKSQQQLVVQPIISSNSAALMLLEQHSPLMLERLEEN